MRSKTLNRIRSQLLRVVKAHIVRMRRRTSTKSRSITLVVRSVEDLQGFQKVRLQPGETREVTFRITSEDLKFYNGNPRYDREPGGS